MCKISLKMKTLRCVKFLMKSRLLFLDFTDSKVLLYTHTDTQTQYISIKKSFPRASVYRTLFIPHNPDQA